METEALMRGAIDLGLLDCLSGVCVCVLRYYNVLFCCCYYICGNGGINEGCRYCCYYCSFIHGMGCNFCLKFSKRF